MEIVYCAKTQAHKKALSSLARVPRVSLIVLSSNAKRVSYKRIQFLPRVDCMVDSPITRTLRGLL